MEKILTKGSRAKIQGPSHNKYWTKNEMKKRKAEKSFNIVYGNNIKSQLTFQIENRVYN